MEKKEVRKAINPTFIVEVKSTKKHTWQGVLTWVEEQKTIPFRSTLELLRMMDSTVNMDDDE